MTKEEEKAIENLTKLLKQRNEKQVKITTYNLFENIETVLNILKQNSAELAEKSAEIEKKDKIIDLMADFMYKTGTGRRALSCMFRQNDECNENSCKYCIKKYFERKVKNEL